MAEGAWVDPARISPHGTRRLGSSRHAGQQQRTEWGLVDYWQLQAKRLNVPVSVIIITHLLFPSLGNPRTNYLPQEFPRRISFVGEYENHSE